MTVLAPAEPVAPAPDFTPVPTRRRIAGWTPARQAAFIAALGDGHTVGVAAASVGLSARGAYRLRRAADGADFALAWDAALMAGADRLDQTAIDRAIHGEMRTVFHRGEPCGERVVYDNGLLMRLLKHKSIVHRKSARL